MQVKSEFQPILCNFYVRQLKILTKGQQFIFIKKIHNFDDFLIFQPTFSSLPSLFEKKCQ